MSDSSIETQWSRIESWLQENAPLSHAELLDRDPEAVGVLAERLSYDLPPDLWTYFQVQPGARRTHAARILVSHRPLGPRDAVDESDGWRSLYETLDPDMTLHSADNPAGGMAWAWLPQFVPLSEDYSGNMYFADLRAGPLRGCVKFFDHEEGALLPPAWSGVVEMLTDLAASLEEGRPCDHRQPHVLPGGVLDWEVV
ncbi:MAG TPA: hypothetical protein VK988_19395 [Acidimicrobiales bacterium]|nr:hypothetical protein [Acidimicrobiales bacterium]